MSAYVQGTKHTYNYNNNIHKNECKQLIQVLLHLMNINVGVFKSFEDMRL